MRRVSASDMALLGRESSREPNHCGAVVLCEGRRFSGEPVSLAQLVDGIGWRIRRVPRFRRRLVPSRLDANRLYWMAEPKLDLGFHVRAHTLTGPGTWTQLCEKVSQIMSLPVDLRRPPWELHLIDGLDNVAGVGSAGFALVAKVHQAAISQRYGMDLLTVLTSINARASERSPAPRDWLRRRVATSPMRQLAGVSDLHRRRAWAPTRLSAEARAQSHVDRRHRHSGEKFVVPATRFSAAVGADRLAYAIFIELADVEYVSHLADSATVSDVILAVVGGGLRRYLSASSELPKKSLVAATPRGPRLTDEVSTVAESQQCARVALRTDIADDVKRLAAIVAATTQTAALSESATDQRLAALSEAAPGQLLGANLRRAAESVVRGERNALANTTVSYQPGPRVPIYVQGCEVVATYGIGTLYDSSGPFHSVNTYRDGLTISVLADRGAMPDIGFYLTCLRQTFASLRDAAQTRTPNCGHS